MADNSNTLQLTLQIKDDGTVVIDKTVGKIGDLDKTVDKSSSRLSTWKEGWVGLTAKIAAFTAAGYGAYKMLDSFVSEAAEAEAIENRLKFALETTGYTWQYAKSAVDEFASSVQASTRFNDEQARQSLTDMMMYTQDFSKAQTGAKLAMDMSIRTGQDLVTTSRYIGMAFSGNAEMLGRYIPELRNLDNVLGSNATMAQKAEYAMKILQEKFGGTAQADMDTYAGKVAQFKNAWSDLKEEIGEKFLPVLKDVAVWLTKVTKDFELFFGGGTEKEKLTQRLLEIETKLADTHSWYVEAIEEGVLPTEKIIELERERQDILERIRNITRQRIYEEQQLAAETKKDVFAPDASIAKAEFEKIKKLAEETNQEWINDNKMLLSASEWKVAEEIKNEEEKYQEFLKLAKQNEEDTKAFNQNLLAIQERRINEEIEAEKKKNEFGETLARNMGAAWNFNIKNIITDSQNMGDAVKKVFLGMGDAFTSAVSKMISDWILFGSVTGKYESGKGIIGWLGGGLGGLFGGGAAAAAPAFSAGEMNSMIWLQHGADFWANKPMIIGVGESGRERVTVTPESKMTKAEGGGKTVMNIFYIYANDPISFRDFVRRNPEAIIEVVSRDARAAGPMSKLGS